MVNKDRDTDRKRKEGYTEGIEYVFGQTPNVNVSSRMKTVKTAADWKRMHERKLECMKEKRK